MAKYAIFASYTAESLAAMIKNPSDRAAAAQQVAESLGGSIESFHWMFGPSDALVIADLPDSVSAAAVSVAVSSSGAIRSISTHQLFDSTDQAAILEAAKTALASYTPPGG